MDHRENQEQNTYEKELQQKETKEYNDWLEIDGHKFRVPYRMVKEVIFSDVKKEELIDLEHAARLQYRLMLQEHVLRAKVEFVKQKISIVYNPIEADNRKPKISLEDLIDFLSKEGVHLYTTQRQVNDFDYFKEMYSYFYDPETIRERPPYGYTKEEWAKMRNEYNEKAAKGREESYTKFKEWQDGYAVQHPDVLAEHMPKEQKKESFMERIFGKKKKGEKQFWFHGV